jgi:hypothetical protein
MGDFPLQNRLAHDLKIQPQYVQEHFVDRHLHLLLFSGVHIAIQVVTRGDLQGMRPRDGAWANSEAGESICHI